MARPTHRLDLLLVPDLQLPIERGEVWLSSLEAASVIGADGRPGPQAARLGIGGFDRLHLDRPPAPTLYANRLGGFQVRCPQTSAPLAAPFSQAMGRWRAGGDRTLACPSCGHTHLLDDLSFRPPAAIGPWAVVAAEVTSATWSEEARAWAAEALGALRFVARRT